MFVPLVWRGLGILVPFIYIAAFLLVTFMIITFDLDVDIDMTNLKLLALWVATGGMATWFFGKKINAPVPGANGTILRNRHLLFFLPVHYWAFAVASIVLLLGVSVQKRFAYVKESYQQERAGFIDWKQRMLEYVERPRMGDYYYFEQDSRVDGKIWRGARLLLYQVVDVDDNRVKLMAPATRYEGIMVLPKPEDYAQYFPETPEPAGQTFWVKKDILHKAIAQNFHKQRSFAGQEIADINVDLKCRLREIKRF